MKRRNLITILFILLLAIGLLLWLGLRPKNQPTNHVKKTPDIVGIDRDFPTHAVNSGVTRATKINNKSCLVSDEQAVAATEKFMNKIGLPFQGSPIVKDISLSNVGYPGIRNLKEVIYGYPSGKMKVRFNVGCESGVVEDFADVENWEDNFPYSAKKEPSNTKKAIESLAKQIDIPSDMHFEKVEYDWRKGVWVGKFVRIRDGYKYDLDNVAIGILGRTGKIALYKKIYFGQGCPTKIKIQKDEAVRIAGAEFHKAIFGLVKFFSDQLYDRNERLLIVQPERPEWALGVGQEVNPPLKEKPSRLAWVIRYDFTGGIKPPRIEEMSPQEEHSIAAYLSKREFLLNIYGNPVDSFEMRIDAGNGEILYVSQ